ncbi:MAG: alpha/beta hydrolase, partial [Pseudomonadota bacterium]
MPRFPSPLWLLGLHIFLVPAAAAFEAPDIAGYWAGHINYRGADLAVGIEFAPGDPPQSANLDIPPLVYARQPIALNWEHNQPQIELPFGIGAFDLELTEAGELAAVRAGFDLRLRRSERVRRRAQDLAFGAFEPSLTGTLYLPEPEQQYPLVVLISGSGAANRSQWSYASWVEFYLGLNFGVFVYDRRPDLAPLPDGSIAGIEHHAQDVVQVIEQLRQIPGVDDSRIGLVGASRGAWISLAASQAVPDVRFLVLTSAAGITPAEQEIISVLGRMARDGLDAEARAQARNYLRLYFYVAQSGQGWELLRSAMAAAEGAGWFAYVDQPRSLEDLRWWRANMNFGPTEYLHTVKAPVLALWGGADVITPGAQQQRIIEAALAAG